MAGAGGADFLDLRAGLDIATGGNADAGPGVAVTPCALQAHRYALRIAGITYRGRQLREPLNIMWNRRRPLPPYATAFCDMLAAYVREVFPITARRRSAARRAAADRPCRRPMPRFRRCRRLELV